MLAFVPVVFDLYRPLKPHLRWTLQSLVSFADRAGRCFPSVRKLAGVTGISKSSVSRHLAELARAGILTRQRRPGGCYSYCIDSRFLPAARGVSHKRDRAVPPARTEEHPRKQTERFAKSGMLDGTSPDPTDQWAARIRSWQRSRFWLPQHWGPAPNEPGCFAPLVLRAMT